MQSGPQQGGGGHGRNMVPGPPSSSASPTSSSSAVSTPHLGFDPMKQQHQQQRQSLQQQLLRNPDGREAMLAYQSGIRQGVLGGGVASNSGSMQMQRVVQQHGQEEGQNMRQGFDQHMMNPMQQAYMQYALHAQQAQQAQQKSSPGMQAQQQMNMGNTKIQDILSFQTANQPQSSLSKKPLEQQAVSDQSQNQNQKHLMPGNSIRPMQTLQPQQSIHNMATSQASMAAQLQAMQAMALERNIDLSLPQNANMIAQMMPLMQSRMLGQQKVNESNMSPQSMSKQQVTNENQLPPRQPTTNGSGMSCMPPPQSPASMNRSSPQSNGGGSENPLQSQKQTPHPGFTKQQLHVLKAQILAFRRIKKGDKVLPRELLQAIAPPPLEVQVARSFAVESSNNDLQAVAMNTLKKEVYEEKEKEKEKATSIIKETPLVSVSLTKQEQEVEHMDKDKGKAVVVSETTTHSPQTKDPGPSRKYHGPLFDFPFFTRKNDGFGSSMMMNNNNNLSLAYDVKDLFLEEELNKRKNENLKKINGLLAVNLERKRIRPDLVLRLQIEEKKLLLKDVQTRVRDEVDQQQQEIMAMPDRPYRKFVRLCERQRLELNRQVHAAQRAIREKQLKSIFQWRKKLLESHWAIRDARTSRNRGVAKYHEKMLREFSKKKDDSSQSKRMEALKNNDVERYREILLEQQTSLPSEAAERYEVLSSFLSQTEDYLHKLGSKITAAKNQQEVEEAANVASTAARAQGLSEEEVRAAASCAREEVLIRNRFSEMNAPQDSSSVSKYYTLAHAVSEKVIRQPSMLRKGTLRDYQLVGLQWMLSLYNNKLNGILADEMGLGKTVQVMALIAYLMEFKSNYGPHLIIVPNAVLVNWKSELHSWLPSVSCIYYVGNKDQRSKLFSQEVCAMKFNVLVTTYEFIMFDRAKLSRVDWKYIIIDEAQRMKDRESVLARDLDKYRCQRRLLLTGTPLQNDLKELWSLLNLLLPDVFDNRKAFHDWFSQPFQKEASHNGEDDWLETEKKVIIIHRLHQILEPFMLRRRVEDVEGSLPPKISIILRCKMSAIQGAVYDWIKSTGTIRVDPEDEKRKVQKSSMYQAKTFKPLNNRCMELRKTCNHPLLNYPYFNDFSKDFLVKSCGKLWVLDRILIKLQRTGHRVLLFSTMTKLLDILEEYLQWRRLVYRRIDGTTSLEDRESAIVDFNSPDTDCFIFLLSIRAAGRGLNLQTADTVVIYDPDPNPKNEEQAVARAHRIGQTREVKVIYMEAVVDKVSSHQKEDNFRNGGIVDSDDDFAGKDRYIGSIESLIRNNIQQYKIDMADEVINAGRFDQRTTHEERRSTLETLLRDEERYQETVHDVPSLQEVNRMIARSEEEVEIFDQMDEEFDWTDEMTRYDQVPKWLRAGTREVNMTVARMSKKPPKDILYTDNIGVEITETGPDIPDKRRGRFKGKKFPNYAELDDDIDEFSEASSEEIVNRDSEDEYRNPRVPEVGSSGSSSDNNTRRVIPSAKFGSLSALESRPRSRSKSLHDDLEEGEIAAMSGESLMDLQKSGSLTLNLTRDRDRSEDDQQVLQPKIKRKRSVRVRPRVRVDSSQLLPFDRSQPHLKTPLVQDYKKDQSLKAKRTPPTRKNPEKPIRTKEKDAAGSGPAMTEPIQRRCKNVITKIQRRIDKEGQQIIPLLTDLWKRNESFLDLRKIEVRVDRLEYNGVMDLIGDVQIMLRSGMQFFGFSHEVRSEARKVHDLFFDIMKIAFPDTDFREARSALSFSGPMATKTGLMPPKRPKPMTDIEPEPSLPPRPLSRVPRFGTTSTTRGGPGAAHGPEEEARRLTHPGELVICKKKRKDREKSAMVKHVNALAAGPVSPIGRGIRSPGQSQTRLTQSQSQAFDNVGWANPVKKMRTDAGKRRPSQL